MNDKKYGIRTCLLYDFKLGKNASESHQSLSKVFGNYAPSLRQCQRWFHRFKNGNVTLEDEVHGKPPRILDDEALKEDVELDPTQTTRELAEKFGCHHSTIADHLNTIGKINRCGKWVPHQLSESNKATRVTMAGILLRSSNSKGFFNSIITSDEKWICYDNNIRKRQWLSPGQPPKPMPKRDIHGKKNLLCIWWNSQGLVYFEVLEKGQTVTADLYSQQLGRVDQALSTQGSNTKVVRLLHDNARPHIAKVTQKKIEELKWQVLPHPPYSPDIAPSDYYLFRSMQKVLAGKKFENRHEIEIWVSKFFESRQADFFKKGIYSLRERWGQVIDLCGEYILD